MPRSPRLDVPHLPQHLVVRGNNRTDLFHEDWERTVFLNYVAEALERASCALHAYVLMSNHVHLLATGGDCGSLSSFVHVVGTRFARFINRKRGRTGTLFEGRFRSSLVSDERYLLSCMRYIEMNPVRAGLARHPGEYGWSSYAQNASGLPAGLLTPHSTYVAIAADPPERGAAYRALFETEMAPELIEQIRACARYNRCLGDRLGL